MSGADEKSVVYMFFFSMLKSMYNTTKYIYISSVFTETKPR